MMNLYIKPCILSYCPDYLYVLCLNTAEEGKMTCPQAGQEHDQPPGVSLIPLPSADQFIPMILRDMCWIINGQGGEEKQNARS